MEAHLAELATLDLDVHLGAARQLSLGHLRHQQGRLKEALDEGIAVVQLLSELGEPTTPAWALVAELRVVSGELDEALRIYREELLPVIERHGDLRSKAITLCRIADILLSRGQLVEATGT